MEPETDVRPDRRRWAVLAAVAVAQLMVVLDTTIVNIALPSAQLDLDFADATRQWVITGYALAFGSLLLLGGRIADLVGRRTTFLVGLAGFAVASALGGAAPDVTVLLVARVLQGGFGALLAPAALAVLTTTFPSGPDRGRALGIFGAVAGAGGAVGLVLGGVLTEYLDWRWCMYVNLFFAVFSFVLGRRVLERREPSGPRARLDVLGAVIVSASLFCLVYGCALAETDGWGSWWVIGPVAAGLVLLGVFVAGQNRTRSPLLPMRVLLDRDRGGAFVTILVVGAGMFAVNLFLVYFVQRNLGFSPILSGIAFLPMVFATMASSTLGTSRVLPRFGPRLVLAGGLLLGAVGLGWLGFITADSTYLGDVLGPLLVTGLGMGFAIAGGMSTATLGVLPEDSGVASATVSTMMQVGGSLGTAVFSSVAASVTASGLAVGTTRAAATVSGYSAAFAGGAAVMAVGAVVTGLLVRSGRRESAPTEGIVVHA